jgi:carbamoylphosphate synthase large subunit
LLATFMDVHDIPRPSTVVVAAGSPMPERVSALTFPVLVKPPFESGGDGIRRFEKMQELESFLAGRTDGQDWIIQEYVRGSDIGVNVLCAHGRIIAATVQHAIAPSSTSFAPAIGFEFRDDALAMNVAERLVEKLGWSGVANIDMRLDARSQVPLVLELNGRYWLTLLGSLGRFLRVLQVKSANSTRPLFSGKTKHVPESCWRWTVQRQAKRNRPEVHCPRSLVVHVA